MRALSLIMSSIPDEPEGQVSSFLFSREVGVEDDEDNSGLFPKSVWDE